MSTGVSLSHNQMSVTLGLAQVYYLAAYAGTCTCGSLAGHYSPSLRQRWANLLTARPHVHLASVPVLLLNRNHVLRVVTCGVHAGFLAMRGTPFRPPPVYSASARCARCRATPFSIFAIA